MMSPKITNTLVFLIIAAFSLVIFANSMTKPIGHDEQMYCTAGVLIAQGKTIYRDFSYPSQMPYHPLLCAALFRILNTTHFLLVGRTLSSLCDILVVVCIIGIYRRIFGPFQISAILLGTSAAVLYVFNPFVDYANGFAWNHDLVILLVLLSFWLFISTDFRQKSRYYRVALIGALLTFATCMRITTALVQLLFFVVLLTRPPGPIKQKLKTILPFLIASAIVLIWPIWIIALSPRAFSLNLFHIPALNSELLHRIGIFYRKIDMILIFLTTRACFFLILITLYLCLTTLWQRRKLTIPSIANLLLAVLLVIVFSIIALIPPTMWKQYLALPVPFLLVAFAFPLLYLRKPGSDTTPYKYFEIACVLVIACAVIAAASHHWAFYRVPTLLRPQSWTPIHLHRISKDIAEKTKSPKLILTLAPLYALEGGCDIYTEFSAGSFVYRVADRLSPSDRRLTHSTGVENLKELIEKSPPSALVLRVEPKFLEVPLFQAVGPDPKTWDAKIHENGPIAYFRR